MDWSVHIPLMLHIIFLGLDNSRELVHKHCQQLLLNLFIVIGQHQDHLGISRILMNAKIDLDNVGLSLPSLPVIKHNFTEKPEEVTLEESVDEFANRDSASSVSEDDEATAATMPRVNFCEDNNDIERADVGDVTKALIHFISLRYQKCSVANCMKLIYFCDHFDFSGIHNRFGNTNTSPNQCGPSKVQNKLISFCSM